MDLIHPVRRRTKRRTPRQLGLAPVLLLAMIGLGACGSETGVTSESGPAPESGAASASGGITVQDAWVRATVGTEDASMSAAFMVIENAGGQDVTLVGASTPVAATTELHEMASVDGDMVMQQVDTGIVITAGRSKVLEPGGYHVMLMGIAKRLAAGDEVELALEFSDGTSQQVIAPVKEFTEEEGDYHDDSHSHGPDEMDETDEMHSGSGSPSP